MKALYWIFIRFDQRKRGLWNETSYHFVAIAINTGCLTTTNLKHLFPITAMNTVQNNITREHFPNCIFSVGHHSYRAGKSGY